MSDLVIVGDQAYTREEWEALERKRARDREYRRRPEVLARQREYHRAWKERNRDHVRAYRREWSRRKREQLAEEELLRRIAFHQRFVDHYRSLLRRKARNAA